MFEAGFNTDQLLSYINAQPLSSTPGTKYSYSNANYIVSGAIIQSVIGESFEQNITERILRPLGMSHSYLSGTDTNMPNNAAHAYEDISGIVTDKKGRMM